MRRKFFQPIADSHFGTAVIYIQRVENTSGAKRTWKITSPFTLTSRKESHRRTARTRIFFPQLLFCRKAICWDPFYPDGLSSTLTSCASGGVGQYSIWPVMALCRTLVYRLDCITKFSPILRARIPLDVSGYWAWHVEFSITSTHFTADCSCKCALSFTLNWRVRTQPALVRNSCAYLWKGQIAHTLGTQLFSMDFRWPGKVVDSNGDCSTAITFMHRESDCKFWKTVS